MLKYVYKDADGNELIPVLEWVITQGSDADKEAFFDGAAIGDPTSPAKLDVFDKYIHAVQAHSVTVYEDETGEIVNPEEPVVIL